MSGNDLPGGDERFADWLDGRMNARDLERFEAEQRVNPELRRRAEQYRRTVESVQQALRAPLPKIDIADAVLQRIATASRQSSPLRPTPWHGASRSAVWLSAGVAAALFVGMLLLFQWQPAPERTSLAQVPAPTTPSPTAPAEQPTDQPDVGLLADGKQELSGARHSLDELVEQKVAGAAKQREEASPAANGAGESELAKDLAPALRRVVAPPANDPAAPLPVAANPADDAAPAGRRDADAEARPLPSFDLASTTVPEVRLRRAAVSGEAVPQELTAGAIGAMAFFTLGAQDLGAVFPPGGLQMQRLPLEQLRRYQQVGYVATQSPPAAPTVQTDRTRDAIVPETAALPESTTATAGEAWLIEGTSQEVFHYLEQLSTAGRACGFEVVNGEVPTNELATLLTVSALGGDAGAGGAGAGGAATGRDDLFVGAIRSGGEQDKSSAEPANPEAKAKGQRPTEGPEAPSVAAEKSRSLPALGERGAAPTGRTAAAEGAKSAPPGGPSSPPPAGPTNRAAPSGSPPPAPKPESPRVRVLVVIDRSGPQRR